MKITDVSVIVTNPAGYLYGNYVLVKVTTDEGFYGWGDASLAGRELAVAELIRAHLAQLLIGRHAGDIEDIWQMLVRGGYWRGGPVFASAVAGIDIALWDIKGKVAGLPVYELLGGRCRDGALCYGHAGGTDFAQVLESVHEVVERGFKVVRCQVAIPGLRNTYGSGGGQDAPEGVWPQTASHLPSEMFEPEPYLRTIPAMFEYLRSQLGPELPLCHDTHERLNPIEAARLARELEPYKLFFLEDLMRPEHADSWKLVRGASTTPLAMGELWNDIHQMLPVVSNQFIDYLRCDLSHSGGITQARKMATICEPYGVRTAWHGPADISPITHLANVHVDLAVPNFGVQEYCAHLPATFDVIQGGPSFKDGYLDVDDTPGLGVQVDEDAARDRPYRACAIPHARRADGSFHDW